MYECDTEVCHGCAGVEVTTYRLLFKSLKVTLIHPADEATHLFGIKSKSATVSAISCIQPSLPKV